MVALFLFQKLFETDCGKQPQKTDSEIGIMDWTEHTSDGIRWHEMGHKQFMC